MKNLIVDYIPFEISREQINESLKENDGKLVVKGAVHANKSRFLIITPSWQTLITK